MARVVLPRMSRLVPVAGLALAAGCTDFQTPAELTAPEIIGVIAEPPVVAPGESAELTMIIASPDGPIAADHPHWAMAETYPGVPAMGTVTGHADGTATYQAPAEVPNDLPEGAAPIDSVQVTLALDGRDHTTIKGVAVADVAASNPTITAITVNGQPVDSVSLATTDSIELGVTTDPAPGDDWRFAWYSAAGEIEKYQSSPTAMTASEAGSGFLFVVVRDGAFGAAFRAVPITVQ